MLEKDVLTTQTTPIFYGEIKQLIVKKSKCSSLAQSHSQVLSNLLLQLFHAMFT